MARQDLLNDEIYEKMYQSEGKRIRVTTKDGESYTGFVSVFESRIETEEDEGIYFGVGTILFDPDDDDGPSLLCEFHIDAIEENEETGTVDLEAANEYFKREKDKNGIQV